MHGVRQELLQQQAANIGLPLKQIMLSETASMEDYNKTMQNTLQALKAEGITSSIYGDINLKDLRKYREEQLASLNMKAVFPLWGRATDKLVREFIELGFKAVVVSANARLLDESFIGRLLDESFLNDLPAGVDPAGENGEFHTFVFDGPVFKQAVNYKPGEKVLKSYGAPTDKKDTCFKKDDKPAFDTSFWFSDLLPV